MPIRCEIVSQDRIVYQGDVDMVLLPGVEGMMGILPHHAPLLTVLQYGVITVRIAQDEQYFSVAGGIAEVQPDQVTVLADAAENVLEIDVERAERARQRAEALLQQNLGPDPERYLNAQAALRRSNLRLESARRYRRTRSGR
jgi:F-type H+-transporting ATPase subunit epsilon